MPIEDQPGFRHLDEAGRFDRAFRVAARSILRAGRPDHDDLASRLSDAFRRLARRRLETGLLDACEVEHLLKLELDGRDVWLAYLILTPWSEVEHLLEARGPDRG